MMYFILLPNDSEEDTAYSTNVLGEESFGTFWAEDGFFALIKMVEMSPEMLELVRIKDSKDDSYTIEQFLTILKGLRIKYQK